MKADAEQVLEHCLHGVDVSSGKNADAKSNRLRGDLVKAVNQLGQLSNPDYRIELEASLNLPLLSSYAESYQGICTGDSPRFNKSFWEFNYLEDGWIFQATSVKETTVFSGREMVFFWQNGEGTYREYLFQRLGETGHSAWVRGLEGWGKKGVLVTQMRELASTLYGGSSFDNNAAIIIPKKPEFLPAIWSFVSSTEYNNEVRRVDQKLNVTGGTLVKIPFDFEKWNLESQAQFSNGLPSPYTNNIIQWIFHGHPCGSVIWHEKNKVTALGELRKDESVMQVALARLLGYRWPAELDPEMELADEQRHWVKACEALSHLVDDDGIACIPAVRGEKPAADRLEAMLQAAYGEAWNINVLNELLAAVGASSLEAWLRDKFFEQHCKLFGHRPFIWQVWDGLKDGFSAVINYHKLTADNLDRLIYTYLGDWIRTQEQGVKDKKDGADIRLAAALNLKTELEKIKEGESGYDIFVRWKHLHEQPIGWNPDLNDGVRLNIRPFMSAKDMSKKGAGILRAKPNIDWKKDRGTDVETAPWYHLGPVYGESEGARINDHHLTRAEKLAAREKFSLEQATLKVLTEGEPEFTLKQQ